MSRPYREYTSDWIMMQRIEWVRLKFGAILQAGYSPSEDGGRVVVIPRPLDAR